MLGNCSTLIECEKVLAEAVGKVEFTGQVGLSEEDIVKLGAFIKKHLTNNLPEGAKYLMENTPVALACYLVGHGIYRYRDGDYWTSFSSDCGLVDANGQVRVGQKFLLFLKQLNKPVLDIPEAHKYIANFLLHGGIPQSCLPEYFEQVVQPAVLSDLVEQDDVKAYLDGLRANDRLCRELAEKIRILHWEQKALSRKGGQVARLIKIREEMHALQDQLEGFPSPAELPEDYDILQQRLLSELSKISQKQDALAARKKECQETIKSYRQEDELIVENAQALEKSIQEYRKLREIIKDIANLREEYRESSARLLRCMAEMGWDQYRPELVKETLSEICWDELIAALDEGVKLQDGFSPKDGETAETELRPVKLSRLFWFGLVVFFAGAIPVVINPSQPSFWLFPALGLALVLSGWLLSRTGRLATACRKRLLEEAARDSELLKLQLAEQQKKVYQLAGRMYQPESPCWSRSFGEISAVLMDIRKEYTNVASITVRLAEAQELVTVWRRGFAESAAALALGDLDEGDPEEKFSQAQERIREAFTRKKQAAEARTELEHIEQELSYCYAETAKIQRKIDRARKAVTALGEGDFQRGLELLKHRRRSLNRLKELEQVLAGRGEQIFTKQLLAHSLDELRGLAHILDSEHEEIEKEISHKSRELESVPQPLPYLDKPIRRFLLYGSDWAEEWLAESVRMAAQAMSGKSFTARPGSPLPVRVVDTFHEWWNNRKTELSKTGAIVGPARPRLSAPELRLEPAGNLSLYLPAQRFKLAGEGREAWVELNRAAGQAEGEKYPLNVYLQGPDLGEIEPVSFPVTRLGGTITVTLGFGEEVVQTWKIAASVNGLPCLIFDDNGAVAASEPLPREKLWFLLPEGYYLRPRVSPLEEGFAQLAESHFLQLLDLKGVTEDQIYIVDRQGVPHSFALSHEIITAPRLVGDKIAGVVIDESYPLYLKESAALHLPAAEQSELDAWVVQVRPRAGYPGEAPEYTLSELADVLELTQEGLLLELPLDKASLLGEERCGRYTITVISPGQKKYRFDISFISEFEAAFTPRLCTPADEEAGPVELRVRCPRGVSFTVQPPAELLDTGTPVVAAAVEGAAGYVRGSLTWHTLEGTTAAMPLVFEVPRVRWRIEGLNDSRFTPWLQQVAEIWFGDWRNARELQLFIAVPLYFRGRAYLSLDGSVQNYDFEIKNGQARFNLLPFTDTLSSRPGVQSFSLSLWERETKKEDIIKSLLFRVRTEWKVKDVALEQELEGEIRRLHISWIDLGKMQNRVLRFWAKNRPWAGPVVEKAIPDDTNEMDITVRAEELPAGSYVLEFAMVDPWGTRYLKPAFPKENKNTALFDIIGPQAIISEWETRWLDGNKVEIQGRVTGAGSGLPVEVIFYGRKGANWLSWQGEAVTAPGGLFTAVVSAQRSDAHWVSVTLQTDPPVYIYAVMPEPAPFCFYLDEDADLAVITCGSDIAVVKLTEAADFRGDITLSTDSGNKVLEALQEGRREVDFQLKLTDGSSKKAKLEMDMENRLFTLKLQRGAICTGCYKLLPDTEAWNRHASWRESPSCKSLIPNFEKARARMAVVWDILPWLRKLKSASPFLEVLPLFNNVDMPVDIALGDQAKRDSELAEKLLSREIEWVGLIRQTGWLE